MNNSQTVDQLPREIDVYPMSSIELFERAFCTNFSCCNILFPDLHALLDHYDATTSAHSYDYFPSTPTLITTPPRFPSTPLSSPPSSPSTHNTPDASPPHSRPASLACSAADAPASPGFSNFNHMNMNLSLTLNPSLVDAIIAHAPVPMVHSSICHPEAYALADYPTYEHCYDTATRYLASAPKPAAESSAQVDGQSPGTGTGVGGANKPRRGRRPLSASSSSSLSQSSSPSSSSGTAHQYRKKKAKADFPGRRSRKAYQCPIPGCSKSYLNPNGLKYHQERGKCKIELPIEVKHSNSTLTSTPPASASASAADGTTGTGTGTDTGTNTAMNPPTAPAAAAPVPPGPNLPAVDIHDQQQQEQEQEHTHQQIMHIHHPQPRHAALQWSPLPDEVPRVGELGSESELETESGADVEVSLDGVIWGVQGGVFPISMC